MLCNKCNQSFQSRSELLLHFSNRCSMFSMDLNQADEVDDEECSPSPWDNTDSDPDWSPSPKHQEIYISPQSSPVTPEQEQISYQAERILNSKNGSEMEWEQAESTTGMYNNLNVEIFKEHTQATQEKNEIDIGLEEKIKDRLNAVKDRIAQFKEKRKQAFKMGKRSLARRLTNNIRRDELLLTGSLSNTLDIQHENCLDSLNTPETDYSNQESNAPIHTQESNDTQDMYTKDKSGRLCVRGRKDNYCLYCKKLIKRFCEHVESKHGDTPEGKSLRAITCTDHNERRKEKMVITNSLRKNWNAMYNAHLLDKCVEQGLPLHNLNEKIIVVKRSNKKEVLTSTVACKYCKGQYRRNKLSVHLKKCKLKDMYANAKTQALKKHSTLLISSKSITQEFKNEIINGIHVDPVMEVALNDATIMKFGSDFHKSRREAHSKHYVIREMRDLAKLLIKMKEENPDLKSLKECFSPAHFQTMIFAAQKLANYNPDSGTVNTPSVAYRLSQPINIAAAIVLNEELKKMYETNNDRSKVTAVEDFLNEMKRGWKTELGRICTKSRKKARVVRTEVMALEEDIIKMAAFIEGSYRTVLSELEENENKLDSYNALTHYLVSHIMLLIRRRPVDFKNARLIHYMNLDVHDSLLYNNSSKNEFEGVFSNKDMETCKRFHIFFVPGKNLEVVPIVLTPLMKHVLDALIKHRKNVNIKTDILFVLADEKVIDPTLSLKFIKKLVQLKKPNHLTGNGLRHQAATFSKLHSNHPQYQDFLASMLGHTLATHKKHYDLPIGVLQKIMVCPIMEGIMKGKNYKERVENETLEGEDMEIGCGVEAECALETNVGRKDSQPFNSKDYKCVTGAKAYSKKRWTEAEEELVIVHFSENIINKIPPTRGDVCKFIKNEGRNLNRSVPQVLMFVRNHVFRMQKNVSPKVKRFLKRQH